MKQGHSVAKDADMPGVSRGTEFCIRQGLKSSVSSTGTTQQMPCAPSRGGINDHRQTLVAARGRFAVENVGLIAVVTRTAADSRQVFANGIPSPDAARSSRARSRQITYCVAESVTSARLSDQNINRCPALKTVLVDVDKEYPGPLSNPRKIWGWEETAVLCEYGKKKWCYESASRNRGGARRSVRESGKHVTLGIANAAWRNFAPLLLAASRKGKMAAYLIQLARKTSSMKTELHIGSVMKMHAP